MTSRPSLGPASGVIPGTTFFTEYKQALKALFDAANFPLTSVTGTANVVAAVLQWELDVAGLLNGMKFTITWGTTNSGPATLALNGGSAVPILTAAGAALTGGELVAGSRSIIEFVSGSYRLLSSYSSASVYRDAPYETILITSQTWVKPLGYADDHQVSIEVWGGGGGGGSNTTAGGGGGGAYSARIMRYIDVPSSVSVSIGAGGAINNNGGTTSFGTIIYGYGGGKGDLGSGTDSYGGGAGGTHSAGAASVNGAGNIGFFGGGHGGATNGNIAGDGGSSYWGGGGGGSLDKSAPIAGAGGVSINGGSGGAGLVAGSAPSGGGGAQAAGARGQVRIRL